MRIERTILLQRLTAGFFLILFLFIHIAKATHRHDFPSGQTKEQPSKKAQVASPQHCAVCDFQAAKDAHHFAMMDLDILLHQPLAVYTFFQPARLTSVGLSSSDRGPPASI